MNSEMISISFGNQYPLPTRRANSAETKEETKKYNAKSKRQTRVTTNRKSSKKKEKTWPIHYFIIWVWDTNKAIRRIEHSNRHTYYYQAFKSNGDNSTHDTSPMTIAKFKA